MINSKMWPAPKIGNLYGYLYVWSIDYGPLGGIKTVWVRCTFCGKDYSVGRSHLYKNATRCAECRNRTTSPEGRKKFYGYAAICSNDIIRKRLLQRISHAVDRCTNANHRWYESYGGRGIRVYKSWLSVPEGRRKFLAYLMTLSGWDKPKLQIDRIDNEGNYEPGNLRFATAKTNSNNKRTISRMQKHIDKLEDLLKKKG